MLTAGKIVAALLQEQKELQEGVLRSPASDWPAYCRLVGRHQGLEEAINIVKSIGEEEE